MIREGEPGDELALRALQGLLPESSPALLSYALSGEPLVLVSVEDGDPVGYLLAVLNGEAYVAEVAVSPPRRREGRASALLEALFEEARAAGCGSVRLMVRAEDEPARALYRGMGFDVAERVPDHYEDGVGLLMCRPL